MIIDDLTPTISDNFTDEIPVEQGTATLKTTWQKALDLFVSSAGTPQMDGTASTGSANALARSDHIHPTDTSRASVTDMNGKVAKDGDTMTGDLSIVTDDSTKIVLKNTDMDSSAASLPSTESASIIFNDANDRSAGYVEVTQTTDGAVNLTIGPRTYYNGADVENGITMSIDNAGAYSVTFAHPSAFRHAIGWAYEKNDTQTIGIDTDSKGITGFGQVVSSTARVYLTIYTPRSMEFISTVSVTAMTGGLRGISGYLDSMAYNTDIAANYTVTAEKLTNNAICILVKKSSAFTNATNNTPVTFYGTVSLKFT